MKVFEMWQVGSWFLFEQKAVVFCQVMQFLKNICDYDVIMTSQIHYITRHGVVINRTEFDACICSSFRGVKIDGQTKYTQTELHFIV